MFVYRYDQYILPKIKGAAPDIIQDETKKQVKFS